MKRRTFIAGLGAAAWPLVALAQQTDRIRRVGVLMSYPKDDPEGLAEMAAFRQGLVEHGWIEGHTIDIAVRWPGGNIELAEAFAKELVGLKPDVLISASTPATAALQKEGGRIPIVFVGVSGPVEQGFVQSLARPGGNITGFSYIEASVSSKMLQLLKEIDRRIVRVAVIYNPQTAPYAGMFMHSMEDSRASLGVEVMPMLVQSASEIEAGMMAFAQQPGSGLAAIPDSFMLGHRDQVTALAARMRIPAVYGNPSFLRSGGLMVYAADPRDLIHRAAAYVDRILRGDRPADLPVQQPTRYQLAINIKTAKALGLEIPPTLLALADEVIE